MAAVASFSTSYDMEDSFQVISTQAKVRSLKRVVDTSAAYEEDSWKEMIGQDQEQRESPSVRSLSPDGDLPEKLKRKERRPRSVALNMLDYGDGLRMGENPKILSLLARHGERKTIGENRLAFLFICPTCTAQESRLYIFQRTLQR